MAGPLDALPLAIPFIVAVLTLRPAWTLVRSVRRTKTLDDGALYEDRDGVATKESMAAYSSKQSFIVIFISSGLGLSASIALTVFAIAKELWRNPDGVDLSHVGLLILSWVSRTSSRTLGLY